MRVHVIHRFEAGGLEALPLADHGDQIHLVAQRKARLL